jgi:hypothetical protein
MESNSALLIAPDLDRPQIKKESLVGTKEAKVIEARDQDASFFDETPGQNAASETTNSKGLISAYCNLMIN